MPRRNPNQWPGNPWPGVWYPAMPFLYGGQGRAAPYRPMPAGAPFAGTGVAGTGVAAPYRPMPAGAPPQPTVPPGSYGGGGMPRVEMPATSGGYWNPGVYRNMGTWIDSMEAGGYPAGWYSGSGRLYGSGAAGTLGSYNAAGEWIPALTATYYNPEYGNPSIYNTQTQRRVTGYGRPVTPDDYNRDPAIKAAIDALGGPEVYFSEQAQRQRLADMRYRRTGDVAYEARERWHPNRNRGPAAQARKLARKNKNAGVGTSSNWTSAVAQFNV